MFFSAGLDDASDEELVKHLMALTADYSGSEIARMVDGVSQHDVSRWRRGDFKRLSASKRRAIKAHLQLRAKAGPGFWPAATGGGRSTGGVYPEPEVLDLFRSVDHIAKYLSGVAPPGEQTALKRDILEGIRRVVTATQPLPQWWLRLQEMVESGEI